MRELAKQICQYNGQRGTENQILSCLISFNYNMEMMKQFAKGRIK